MSRIASLFLALALIVGLPTRASALDTVDTFSTQFVPRFVWVAATASSTAPSSSAWVLSTLGDEYYGFQFVRAVDGVGSASNPYTWTRFRCATSKDSIILPAGTDVDFTLPQSSAVLLYNYTSSGSSIVYSQFTESFTTSVRVRFLSYDDSSIFYSYTSAWKSWDPSSSDLIFSIPASDIPYNVAGVEIEFYVKVSTYIANNAMVDDSCCVLLSATSPAITMTYYPASTLGFLGTILEVIQNIFNSIVELPSKIATLIIDGIKSLFIPSADDLEGVFQTLQDNLSQKLGAVYQAFDLVLEVFRSLAIEQEAGSVNFPGLSLSLAGATFSIPAQTVLLWPGGFSALQEPVRLGCTMVLVVAWVNGLIRRFSAFIGDKEG